MQKQESKLSAFVSDWQTSLDQNKADSGAFVQEFHALVAKGDASATQLDRVMREETESFLGAMEVQKAEKDSVIGKGKGALSAVREARGRFTENVIASNQDLYGAVGEYLGNADNVCNEFAGEVGQGLASVQGEIVKQVSEITEELQRGAKADKKAVARWDSLANRRSVLWVEEKEKVVERVQQLGTDCEAFVSLLQPCVKTGTTPVKKKYRYSSKIAATKDAQEIVSDFNRENRREKIIKNPLCTKTAPAATKENLENRINVEKKLSF
eukprot:TRINITY_DN19728_c0_g1_i1.p1 TRINITY_DN19728_c0_g1~~TRINITY_DN19728_c0_g1_i1.p1  ORF type:complete len:269 (+),score=57.25 TRINITY_DN19728_c0_g1_i1:615-1421(+)